MSESELQESPLALSHQLAGARFTAFAGWNMPLLYSSILEEHRAVRESAGLFDISHMGELRFAGPDAGAWLNTMLTNDTRKLRIGRAQYTLLLNEKGGVIDDLMLYRIGEEEWFIIANASRVIEVRDTLAAELPESVTLVDESAASAAVALQGPLAAEVFESAFAVQMPARNHVMDFIWENVPLFAAGTGYTGEAGCEVVIPASSADRVWTHIFQAAGDRLRPCGLASRDTLRLEVCYPLNGNDLSPERSPFEAGLDIFVKMDKGDFQGRTALQRQLEGDYQRLVAFIMEGKTPPPRAHCPVMIGGVAVGEVTSGSQSPSLGAGIGLAMVPESASAPGSEIGIEIRGQIFPARIHSKPLYHRPL